jgi:hypothetical protein
MGPLPRLLEARAEALTLLAVTIALGARLAFGFGYWIGKPLTHDEQEYLALAENLARGRGFTYEGHGAALGEERFSRPPLYPVFAAAVAAGPLRRGDRPAAIRRLKIAQAIVGAAGVAIVGHLARAAGVNAAAWVAWRLGWSELKRCPTGS